MIHDAPPTPKIPATKRRGAVAYARVSTLQQSHESLSIEGQFDSIRCYAAKHKMDITLCEMDELSAYGPGSENRPGLQSAIRHAKTTGGIVIVYRVSRLSRWVASVDVLRATGVRFHSVDTGYLSEERFRRGVLKAQEETDHKSQAQKMQNSLARLRGKKRPSGLRPEDRRTGTVHNQLRRDDNIRAVANHFCNLPGMEHMTHGARAESLRLAGIFRTVSARKAHRSEWSKESLRKQWSRVLAEIELLRDEDALTGGDVG
ncbi:recombinase family protein [Puniceibacterium confluentis]|uniref:recombinase family protein n=1 Tax=Puniceibacterium confluentis TaxID=1958944 RepID=UPI0011B5FC02|nr:recombinase family protein [Puniceibacterium confluentis]